MLAEEDELLPVDGAAVEDEAAVSPVSGLSPDSFILDLENIFSSSYINQGVYRIAANADFVVQMGSG